MGSASSKFKKYLQHGDEFAAMQVFQSSPELCKNLDPNVSYGDSHHHNTAMHYAAKHGMKHLLRTFLNDLGGNPNKKNACNETSLHAACVLPLQKSFSAQERRAACVALVLQWRGVALNTGQRERIDLQAQDSKGNTALHCAASSGLKRCVELLVSSGSPLFLENHDRLTPCDMAMRSNYHNIAQLLESKMVFDDTSDTINEAVLYGGEQEEVYSGLRTQDLQEAKDQLLVETSDMLHIPLFTAEALLRDNEWSREALLEKWMKDPVQCCQLAGVQPPSSAMQHCGPESNNEYNSEPNNAGQPQCNAKQYNVEIICEICTLSMPCWDLPVLMSCNHRFCTSCWESYLTVKIQDGDAHHILCPAYQCHILVPVEVIERIVSPDMARRYLQFDIKAFVESNRSIKWCPMPGCGRAVRLPETEQAQPSDVLRSVPSAKPPPLTSHAVDCGAGHFFCWECLGEAHAPSGCDQWQLWQHKIAEVKPEELRASCVETEDAANCLWLVTNSKPCPNCKSPIQKNEGCNHMKCSKCKCDFCWVCLENWKKHSSATGGYFRCNRFEAVHKADEKQGVLISEAMMRNQQMQELNRFLHYYTRFRNHENSQKMEEPLLNNVKQKMDLLASSFGRGPKGEVLEQGKKAMRFVEDGVRELLKARRVLCGSYVYGYYLEDNGYNKTIFEFMQNELEEVTEKLSEMVARPYLRTQRSVIIQTTALARRKRHEFVRAVSKGLIPPETPPALRKVRKRRFPGLLGLDPGDDDQMTHAIAASLKDLDPDNPWVQGRPPTAPHDWPAYDSDGEDTEVGRALAVSLVGECSRVGCKRPRARNPRTAGIHDFCSIDCSRLALLAEEEVYRGVNVSSDYNMDLVIALEMSRLQMIEDEMKKCQRAAEAANGGAGTSVVGGGGEPKPAGPQQAPSTPAPAPAIYHKTSADLTVDYFLRSLAGRRMDPDEGDCDGVWGPGGEDPGAEDGRFEIGDLHENGGRFNDRDEDFDDVDARLLKRSHSTGDLCSRGGRGRGARGADDHPGYHLDSDHSSRHEEKPEDAVKRLLALPSGRRFLMLHSNNNSNTTGDSEDGTGPYFGGQSSVEDTTTTTTTSDSLNADLEVCGILGLAEDCPPVTVGEEEPPRPPPLEFQTLFLPRMGSNSLLEAHRRAFRAAGGKAAGGCNNNNNLRIRICKSPSHTTPRPLETDSSNEYESETGIPKSPTLFISGVSISRTPEPRSPAVLGPSSAGGRQSRSSSLTVPSTGRPLDSRHAGSLLEVATRPPPSPPPPPPTPAPPPPPPGSPAPSPVPAPKSKSANEPEREREMFRFPKSSTDGALSSVLHIQESNLSSDDFHEALFLLERSPKGSGGSSKRRKKSKKERDKDKENSNAVGGPSKVKEVKEASSAL